MGIEDRRAPVKSKCRICNRLTPWKSLDRDGVCQICGVKLDRLLADFRHTIIYFLQPDIPRKNKGGE